MKSKSNTIIVILAVTAAVGFILYQIIHFVCWFLGYVNPIERKILKIKTDKALEQRYPEHDFTVEQRYGWGEYGFYVGMDATDENGIVFRVQWVEDEMQDQYHARWNEFYYGKKMVEYQNELRDKYFPQIPYVDTYEYADDEIYDFGSGTYKEVFFESMDEAIEASKSARFSTKVTFKGIDLDTADDEEIARFADSIADSLMWLYEETGYDDIRIGDFHYIQPDEYGGGYKTREELLKSIMKEIEFDRERK